MKKLFVGLAVLSLLFGLCSAIAVEDSLPAWAADPLKYNSCTDYYRDRRALLIDGMVYYTELSFEYGTYIMTVVPGKPETTRVLRHLDNSDYIFNIRYNFFDMGTGLLLIEVNSGIIYSLSYDGSELTPLFTLEDSDPCFSILVGQNLYCNQGNQIINFDLNSGEKKIIYELPQSANTFDRFSWNVEYAEGYLLVRVEKTGFYSIDVQSGKVYRLDDFMSIECGADRAMLIWNGRVYAQSNELGSYGLYSVDLRGQNPIKVCDIGLMRFWHASDTAVLLRDDYINGSATVDMIFFSPDGSFAAFDPNNMSCIVSPTTNKSSFMLGDRIYFVNYKNGITTEDLPHELNCYDSILIKDLLEQSVRTTYPDLLSDKAAGSTLVLDLLNQVPYHLANVAPEQ